MKPPKPRLILLQLLREQPIGITALELSITQLALESLALDNFSNPDMVPIGKKFLTSDGPVILALWKEEGSSWGTLQPLIRDLMKWSDRIRFISNREDPLLSKLKNRLTSYELVSDQTALTLQVKRAFAQSN